MIKERGEKKNIYPPSREAAAAAATTVEWLSVAQSEPLRLYLHKVNRGGMGGGASFVLPGQVWGGGLDDDKEPKWRKREGDWRGSQAWTEVTDEEDADLWLVGGRIREVAGRGGCGVQARREDAVRGSEGGGV